MVHPHDWFSHDRFGLFVHFGLYSTLARHEWVMTHERTSAEDYAKNAEFFDPDRFDARALVRAAALGPLVWSMSRRKRKSISPRAARIS